jgi:hypothetical protein
LSRDTSGWVGFAVCIVKSEDERRGIEINGYTTLIITSDSACHISGKVAWFVPAIPCGAVNVTYGSRLSDADINLKKIARLMGLSNTKQTERYVHPDDKGLLKATEVASRGGRTRIVPERLRRTI